MNVAFGPAARDHYGNLTKIPNTKWKPGQLVEVAWQVVANYGGGYSSVCVQRLKVFRMKERPRSVFRQMFWILLVMCNGFSLVTIEVPVQSVQDPCTVCAALVLTANVQFWSAIHSNIFSDSECDDGSSGSKWH